MHLMLQDFRWEIINKIVIHKRDMSCAHTQHFVHKSYERELFVEGIEGVMTSWQTGYFNID